MGAHHAIISTENVPKDALDAEAKKIYDLITRAYLAQFYPPERSRNTRVLFQAAEHRLQAMGRVVVDPGWRSLYTAETKEDPTEATDLEAVQCPRCQEGALRKRKGSKRVFWGCSRSKGGRTMIEWRAA